MNGLKKALLPIIFLVTAFAILIAGLISFDIIPSVFNGDSGQTGNTLSADNSEVIKGLGLDKKELYENANKLSENMNAIWIDEATDFDFSPDDEIGKIKYSIYSDVYYYKNFIADTYFIKPDLSGLYSGLKDENGESFDVISYFLFFAKQLSVKSVLVADMAMITDGSGIYTFDKISEYINKYGFNAVLFSDKESFYTENYYSAVKFISDNMKKSFPRHFFGAEIYSDFSEDFEASYYHNVFEEELLDFALADCYNATGSKELNFSQMAYYWDNFAYYYDIPFYCKHRADKIFTSDPAWADGKEINRQLDVLLDYAKFDGSCYYKASSLKNKRDLARALSIYLNKVAKKTVFSCGVSSLELDSSVNSVRFKGFISPDKWLFCSDDIVNHNNGSFDFSRRLLPGENKFFIAGGDDLYKYYIYNNMPPVIAHAPQNNAELTLGEKLKVTAVCRYDSVVYTVLNGKSYEMLPSSEQVNYKIPDGYSLFTCVIDTKDTGMMRHRELSIACGIKEGSVIARGGKITVSDKEGFKAPDFTPVNTPSVSFSSNIYKVSPFFDNGLGNKLMCRIRNENTEPVGDIIAYDTFKPFQSDITKGTLDYVESITKTESGSIVYILESGLQVYASTAELINNAYVMPPNNVSVKSYDEGEANKVTAVFSTEWLVPVTISSEPQDYKKGYLDFSYNIDKYTADYIDITFYHTASFSNGAALTFGESSPFSKHELYSSGDDTLILRLYLKSPGAFSGYNMFTDDEGNLVITFKKKTQGIKGKVIMLDPGHGGLSMVGTANQADTVSEATVTLSIAGKVKKYLENMGAEVIMTRTMDAGFDLEERLVMCEKADPDAFISIHSDGSDKKDESGTHTFYYKPYSRPLADCIHERLVETYRNSIYTPGSTNFEKIDKQVKYYPFYVTRVDNCPSVLVETGFLSNYIEGLVLVNPTFQDYIAKAIADGISNYFR